MSCSRKRFYIKACAAVVTKVDYLSLSDIAYRQDLRRLSEGVTGTAFAGEPSIVVSVQDILARNPNRRALQTSRVLRMSQDSHRHSRHDFAAKMTNRMSFETGDNLQAYLELIYVARYLEQIASLCANTAKIPF
jgi:hypothetical protein